MIWDSSMKKKSRRHKAEVETIKWQHTVINNNKHIHIQGGKLQKVKLPEEIAEMELNKCMSIDKSKKKHKLSFSYTNMSIVSTFGNHCIPILWAD